jgi:hypothetical protein
MRHPEPLHSPADRQRLGSPEDSGLDGEDSSIAHVFSPPEAIVGELRVQEVAGGGVH